MGAEQAGKYNSMNSSRFTVSPSRGDRKELCSQQLQKAKDRKKTIPCFLSLMVYGLLSVVLCLYLSACGITVKEYKLRNLSGVNLRVHIVNNTYEAGAAYAFKTAIEEKIVKKGGNIVEQGEDYEVRVTLREIKMKPVSFTKSDIANVYNLEIKGAYKISSIKGGETKTAVTDNFSRPYSYAVSGVEQTEINRQLIIEQAAREIADTIADRVAIMLPAAP